MPELTRCTLELVVIRAIDDTTPFPSRNLRCVRPERAHTRIDQNDDLPARAKRRGTAQVVLGALMFDRRSDRIDPGASRIEGPAEAVEPIDPLPLSIRTFEDDDWRRSGFRDRLLDELKHALKRGQAAL